MEHKYKSLEHYDNDTGDTYRFDISIDCGEINIDVNRTQHHEICVWLPKEKAIELAMGILEQVKEIDING